MVEERDWIRSFQWRPMGKGQAMENYSVTGAFFGSGPVHIGANSSVVVRIMPRADFRPKRMVLPLCPGAQLVSLHLGKTRMPIEKLHLDRQYDEELNTPIVIHASSMEIQSVFINLTNPPHDIVVEIGFWGIARV